MTTKANLILPAVYEIKAGGEFATAEILATQAEYRAETSADRLFYRRLAAVCRLLTVRWLRADVSSNIPLPDAAPDRPEKFDSEICDAYRANRQGGLPLAIMLVGGEIERLEVKVERCPRSSGWPSRSLIGYRDSKFIDRHEQKPDEEQSEFEAANVELSAAATTTISDDDLTDFAAVLRSMHNGQRRPTRKICELVAATGLTSERVLAILRSLESQGRVRRLAGNAWQMVAVASF